MNDDTQTSEDILPVRDSALRLVTPWILPQSQVIPTVFSVSYRHILQTETESPSPQLPKTRQAAESQAMWLQVHMHKQQHKHAHG